MELQIAFTKSKRSIIIINVSDCCFPIISIISPLIIYVISQCVAVDAVVETELVAVLQVSSFPEIIFTKAGKILFREKGNGNSLSC